jgi:hypothetical protein
MIPVVACLAGNDYMAVPKLETFHNHLLFKYAKNDTTTPLSVIVVEKENIEEEEETTQVIDVLDEEEDAGFIEEANAVIKVFEKIDSELAHILHLISRYVSEHFDNEHRKDGIYDQQDRYITIESANNLFKVIFKKNAQKINLCTEVYGEYVVRELGHDHKHFSYENLFRDYIPFNPNALLNMSEHDDKIHRATLIQDAIDRFRTHALASEVVDMAAFGALKLSVPLEDPNQDFDTQTFYRPLRRRFNAYLHFHDVEHHRVNALLHHAENITLEETFVRKGQYMVEQYRIDEMLFRREFPNRPLKGMLDHRKELLQVYRLDEQKAKQLTELLRVSKQENKIPGEIDAHMILLLVINMMFMLRDKNDRDIHDWEYQCLLASLCNKPLIDELAPCNKLANHPGLFRFTPKLYKERNAQVQNVFLHPNFYHLVARFLVGLKFFSHINQWFDSPFSIDSLVNATLMFNGCRFAKFYMEAYTFLNQQNNPLAQKRFNIHHYLRSNVKIQTYETLVDALVLMAK